VPPESQSVPTPVARPATPLLSRAQVLAAYGDRSVAWLYENMANGRIPRPVRIGPNSVAWITEQIRADIEAKIAIGPVALTPRLRKKPLPLPQPDQSRPQPARRAAREKRAARRATRASTVT
jgi:predicted DNA-binding transcriptional regulator AlpA